MTLNLAPELVHQINLKSVSLGVSFEAAACVLLHYGLARQAEHEQQIERLTEALVSSANQEDEEAAANLLGEKIFGR